MNVLLVSVTCEECKPLEYMYDLESINYINKIYNSILISITFLDSSKIHKGRISLLQKHIMKWETYSPMYWETLLVVFCLHISIVSHVHSI